MSLSFPVGDMRILKGSCREVGMSAPWMLPPLLKAGSGCWGPTAGVGAATLDFPKPFSLFLSPPPLLVLSLPSSGGQLSRHFSMGMGRGRGSGLGRGAAPRCASPGRRWAGVGQRLGGCGLDGGAVGAGHLTTSGSSSSPSSCPRQRQEQPSSLLGGPWGLECVFAARCGRARITERGRGGPGDLGQGPVTT